MWTNIPAPVACGVALVLTAAWYARPWLVRMLRWLRAQACETGRNLRTCVRLLLTPATPLRWRFAIVGLMIACVAALVLTPALPFDEILVALALRFIARRIARLDIGASVG